MPAAKLPAPPLPPECDLTGFHYMPLDVRRLRDSDVAALENAEGFRGNVLAWCVAWQQVPAASLPADDASLCRLLGYGRDMASWQSAKSAGALHGFILHSDGRLYHPVVAEKALEAWNKKARLSNAGRRGNAKRWQGEPQSNGQAIQQSSPPDRDAVASTETPSSPGDPDPIGTDIAVGSQRDKGDKGDKIKDSLSPTFCDGAERRRPAGKKAPKDWRQDESFRGFYERYPRKIEPAAAYAAWQKAIVIAAPDRIMAGLTVYPFRPDAEYIPHPATWLNKRAWESEPAASVIRNGTATPMATAAGRVLSQAELLEVST